MPRWSIWALAILFSAGTIAVGWTLIQAIHNYLAVTGGRNVETMAYAKGAARKLTGLFVVQGALTMVAFLSIPIPRQDWQRFFTLIGLLVMSMAVVWVSFEEFFSMRILLEGGTSEGDDRKVVDIRKETDG